ncbi:amidase family protein [Teichococcus oryzae]|uniref:Amidase n=1 Tax=Teichococcus oryzae TaxID=1608942 RepID=A0A5B2TIS6_9PROT|nr:amidase [Pseudoroseomonas oryzae]KAA2214381.1 amidase [Pseudoroseomonas oryzae]
MTPQLRPYTDHAEALVAGRETPRAVLEACLEAMAMWEPQVGAFTATDVEGARRAADAATARWKEGRPLSAIDGMTVGIKDIIDTDDLPTQMGSALYEGYRPRFSAASAWALRDAGAVILGKTVTTEFASTEPRGTRNPWDLSRTPGGSSSGSGAAVAAGMLSGAMGTQVVGSIIRPAGYTGVYGFKPSVGGINRGGSLDMLSHSCSGTMAASLSDAWCMARAITERVGGDPGHPGLGGPLLPPEARRPATLALLRTEGWPDLHPEAGAALEGALDSLRRDGIRILTQKECPELAALEGAVADARELALGINAWEWLWPLGAFAERDAAALSPSARERLARARAMTRAEYAALLERRAAARAAYAKLAGLCEALVSVTAAGAAPVGLGSTGNPAFVAPGSVLGVPVVSLPVLRCEGLPLGLQLLGFRDEDAALFAHAAWIGGRL